LQPERNPPRRWPIEIQKVERNVDAARKLSIGPRFHFRFAIENRARACAGPINKSRECNRRSSRCFSVFTIKFARPRGAGRLAELLTLALAYSLQRRSLSCFAARVLTLFRFVLGTKQRARARARHCVLHFSPSLLPDSAFPTAR